MTKEQIESGNNNPPIYFEGNYVNDRPKGQGKVVYLNKEYIIGTFTDYGKATNIKTYDKNGILKQ